MERLLNNQDSSQFNLSAKAHNYGPTVYTYPFMLGDIIRIDLPAGGLQTDISKELTRRAKTRPSYRLNIISNDDRDMNFPEINTRVRGADANVTLDPEITSVWFDEYWSYLHPDAFTSKGQSNLVLTEMYKGEYATDLGSIARIAEHHNKYGVSRRNSQAEQSFVQRMEPAVQAIESNSVVNWVDYFFAPLMLKYADQLRARGCFQTYHHHMTLSPELKQFAWGRNLLLAISKVDVAFVHTDDEIERLQDQLRGLSLPIPEIKRYDMGIDQTRMIQYFGAVNRDNYMNQPEFKNLSREQREVVDEIYRTQGIVPHRFLDIGRLDPQKGTSVLLEGIDAYLSSLGENADTLRKNYRFFFVMERKELRSIDTYNLRSQYNLHVNNLIRELQVKYPGILFASSGLPRVFIPSLLKGAHAMTGGIQDGLNLAVQESLFINALTNQDANGIIGMGTGFAIQTMKSPRHKDLVYFISVGDSNSVAQAIRQTVNMVTNNPGELRRRTKQISEEVVERRNDSLFARPE